MFVTFFSSDSNVEKMDSDKTEDRISPLNQEKADLMYPFDED